MTGARRPGLPHTRPMLRDGQARLGAFTDRRMCLGQPATCVSCADETDPAPFPPDDPDALAQAKVAVFAPLAMAGLSGRTPPALRKALSEWPLVSAPMAEALIGASRAAVQRNLAWMEDRGLIREVTGQGRFRMWRIRV